MKIHFILNVFIFGNINSTIHPESRLRSGNINGNIHPESRLRSELKSNYDSLNRPVRNMSTVTIVKYVSSLYQLVGFDSKEQSIELLTFQRLRWCDEFLKWDPANHSGIELSRFYQHQLWVPDVLPYNDIGDYDFDKFSLIVPLIVYSSGHVVWSQPVNMKTTCSMDVTNFPFDSQTCEITIGSWQYSSAELRMSCDDELDLNAYIPDSLWDLQGFSIF